MTKNNIFRYLKMLFFLWVINVRVKIFDEEHEKDLESKINEFLKSTDCKYVDIKFTVAVSVCGEDQIYCFSAMILYDEK